MEEGRGPGRLRGPVDYILHLGLPESVRLKLIKMLGEAKGFLNSAHTIVANAEQMDKGGYDIPELSVLKWMLDGCIQLTHVVLRRLCQNCRFLEEP